MSVKIQIKISDILRMLKEGYTRKALATHYGVTQSAMKQIFQHPELKGKRTMPKVEETYQLVDDVSTDAVATDPTPVDDYIAANTVEDHANGTQEQEDHADVLVEDIEINDPWIS